MAGLPPRPKTDYIRVLSQQFEHTNKLLSQLLLKSIKEVPMVCRDPIDPAQWDQRSESEIHAHQVANLEARISKLTNMLCAVCSRTDEKILTQELIDVGNWWFDHKRSDMSREETERRMKEQQIQYKKRMMEDLKKEIEALEKL